MMIEEEGSDETPTRVIRYEVDGKPIIVPSIRRLQEVMTAITCRFNHDKEPDQSMKSAFPGFGMVEIAIQMDPQSLMYSMYVEYEVCTDPDRPGFEIGTTLECDETPYHWYIIQDLFIVGKDDPFRSVSGVLQIPQSQYAYDQALRSLCERLFRLAGR